MIKVKRIDHVAIAVDDRDGFAHGLQQLFDLRDGAREHVSDQKTDVLFLHAGQTTQETAVEVIAPAAGGAPGAGNAGLQKFLDRRGPGLHHICFEVDDLAGALASLKAAGVRLIDEAPRPGARGHMVAFIHPSATGGVLFELCAHVVPPSGMSS